MNFLSIRSNRVWFNSSDEFFLIFLIFNFQFSFFTLHSALLWTMQCTIGSVGGSTPRGLMTHSTSCALECHKSKTRYLWQNVHDFEDFRPSKVRPRSQSSLRVLVLVATFIDQIAPIRGPWLFLGSISRKVNFSPSRES